MDLTGPLRDEYLFSNQNSQEAGTPSQNEGK